jgi:sugar lactone lactonase YvrE
MSRPPIDPVVWQPPEVPFRARWITGPTLPPMRLYHVNGLGPEDATVDSDGHLLTGVDGGRILRISPDGRRLTEVATTSGRPLGVELLPDGRLLVCDAYRGLLRVDLTTAEVEVLVDKVDGKPMRFCKSAAVAVDGTVYFSDGSQRFDWHDWKADLLEHRGSGRLLRRRPNGRVDVLLEGLQLANGVALTPDESAVVVAETGNFRLTRLALRGDGTTDVLADNLPGYPFGISLGTDGLIWVAICSKRHPRLDFLASKPPRVRKAVWKLPERLHPQPIPTVWAVAVDPETGLIVHDLHGPPHWEFMLATSAREIDGTVYLGSVVARAIAAIDLPTRGMPGTTPC